jgi:methylornithine synthase
MKLRETLEKALQGRPLTRGDMVYLLELSREDDLRALFRTARKLRNRYFGKRVFLYGFIYFSTYCRNDCRFCFYRRSNSRTVRYRRTVPEVVEAARILSDSGVHLIDLTAGEGPAGDSHRSAYYDELIDLIGRVKQSTGLPVMVSPGVVADDVLGHFRQAGASWYACYQETYQRQLFRRLRVGQNFERRLHAKQSALQLGLLVEDGILCGVGETNEDTADSILSMGALNASQIRAMTFVPQPGTPMGDNAAPDSIQELRIIAVMRCAFPERLIPASLDVAGLAGLADRLRAGANVVTSIVPPGRGLAGVAHHSLDISDARRSSECIRKAIEPLGLKPASRQAYATWVRAQERHPFQSVSCEQTAC